MSKKLKAEKDLSPIIKLSLLNYDIAKQDYYSHLFMSPLIKGFLKRSYKTKAD